MISFHRRPLPTHLIPFSSPQGRVLFKSALGQNTAESYYSLAECFTTQNEPAFCGLGTLSMSLNALSIDPLRIWKGPWRWYTDEMLDCCRPLADIIKVGITMPEFACLARCNGLAATIHYATDLSLDDFIQLVEECTATSFGKVLVVSYARKTLGQTGDGHFSPLGAYAPLERMVLVMDVARFKYPPYWVDVELLYASLFPHDKATDKCRGVVVLSHADETRVTRINQVEVEDEHVPSSVYDDYVVRLELNKATWAHVMREVREEVGRVQVGTVWTVWKVWDRFVPMHVVTVTSSKDTLMKEIMAKPLYSRVVEAHVDHMCGDEYCLVWRTLVLAAIPDELASLVDTGKRIEWKEASCCQQWDVFTCCADTTQLDKELSRLRGQLRLLTRLVLQERLL